MLARIDRVLAVVTWLVAAFAVVVLLVGPELIGAKKSGGGAAAQQNAPPRSGSAVFASAGCGNCHTLKAAGSSGTTGPNLDQLKPAAATVASVVTNGAGIMPSFKGKLSSADIQSVARYVASNAGR
jgi:mono/diheme cytochrome c family protein